MQFTPIQQNEPDQPAANEAPADEPAETTAKQSQEALINLRQKMQGAAEGARPNPFLAIRAKKAAKAKEGQSSTRGALFIPPTPRN